MADSKTIKQTCRSSLILCDNSNYGMSTRLYSKLAWYEIRVLDAFPLVNCTKICGSHLPVEVRPRCNNHWFWQITDMYVLSIEPHSWSINMLSCVSMGFLYGFQTISRYVILCVYGVFVWLPDNLQICNLVCLWGFCMASRQSPDM